MTQLLNRQRQLAEQGRLRLGHVVPAQNGGTRPTASNTWIVTSHERLYVETAVRLWGGEVERWQPQGHGAEQWRAITLAPVIEAILPTGEPLTQAYEMWSAGGCQRRCDGVTEQFSGSPCLCAAQFGEEWYEQGMASICATKTRLKVILPDMPGIGSWRVETGSFYAADEIAGTIEVIRAAVGESVLVPIQLRIEPRTRTKDGQTRQYVVPVVEGRGFTAGALIAGTAADAAKQVEAAKQQPAIEQTAKRQPAIAAAPGEPGYQINPHGSPEYYTELARRAPTLADLQSVWGYAARSGIPTGNPIWTEMERLAGNFAQNQQGPPPKTVQELWQEVLMAAGELELPLDQVFDEFAQVNDGVVVDSAGVAEMQRYLDHLRQVSA